MYRVFHLYRLFRGTRHEFLFYLAVSGSRGDAFGFSYKKGDMGRAGSALAAQGLCDAGVYRRPDLSDGGGLHSERFFPEGAGRSGRSGGAGSADEEQRAIQSACVPAGRGRPVS